MIAGCIAFIVNKELYCSKPFLQPLVGSLREFCANSDRLIYNERGGGEGATVATRLRTELPLDTVDSQDDSIPQRDRIQRAAWRATASWATRRRHDGRQWQRFMDAHLLSQLEVHVMKKGVLKYAGLGQSS